MAPGIRENKGGLGASLPANCFDHALYALRKRSIIAQRFATYTRKSCKNEKAKFPLRCCLHAEPKDTES